MTTESWKVSDSFWSKVEPLIPKVKREIRQKRISAEKAAGVNQWHPDRVLKQ